MDIFRVKREKNQKKYKNILYVFIVLILFLSPFLKLKFTEALSEGIEFSDDTEVSIGTTTSIYISAGSEAEYVEIEGGTLRVFGVPVGGFFELKTDTHRVLRISSGTITDFSISAAHINSSGFLYGWLVETSGSVNYILGVSKADNTYFIYKDGDEITDSPKTPNAQQEIVFSGSGVGFYDIGGKAGEAEVILGGNEFFGWAYGGETFGWISFNCLTEGSCSPDYRVWTTISGPLSENPIIRTRPAIRTATAEGTSAILVGEILYLGGASREIWFRWGEDEFLENFEETEKESLSSPGIFSKKIEFPESFGTTYYFRAVTSVIGEGEGGEEEFIMGRILSFTVSEGKGTIKVIYGEKERSIFIGEEGSIEIIRQ